MFQFDKDLFLFSLEEEGNEEVDSHMGAAAENQFGVVAYALGVPQMDVLRVQQHNRHTFTWLRSLIAKCQPLLLPI